MQRLSLVAAIAILAVWLFSDRPAEDSLFSAALEAETTDIATGLRDAIPESSSDESVSASFPEETQGISVLGLVESQPEDQPKSQSSVRVFESSWIDHQPDPGVIEFDALQLALDAEGVDPNWGPILQAAAMGAISANQANLLTLTAECKTTICGFEVKQAGELPEGQSQSDIEAMFLEWFKELGQLVRATDLDFWRIQLAPPSVDQNLTVWKIWILRTPPF